MPLSSCQLAPGVICYELAIIACEKGQRWAQAFCFCQLAPGVIRYELAISACEKGQRWAQAEQLRIDRGFTWMPSCSTARPWRP